VNCVAQLNETYSQNRKQNWQKQITVINLIISSAIQAYTYKNGAENIALDMNTLCSYLEGIIVPELQEENIDNLPILKATCIKFIYMFRN
jgi:Cse1